MIKAVVERISSIAPITEIKSVRSTGYQSERDGKRFEQILESKKKQAEDPGEEKSRKSVPDEFIQYVIYDMKAYVSWEAVNRLDVRS